MDLIYRAIRWRMGIRAPITKRRTSVKKFVVVALAFVVWAATFGLVASESRTVSGTVWNDVNQNGLIDEGEPGVEGIVLRLREVNTCPDPLWWPLAGYETTSAQDGSYSMEIPEGLYSLELVVAPERMSAGCPYPTPLAGGCEFLSWQGRVLSRYVSDVPYNAGITVLSVFLPYIQ